MNISNNDIHVSSFLTKVNMLYILAIVAWLSYSVFNGTISFDMKMHLDYGLIVPIVFFSVVAVIALLMGPLGLLISLGAILAVYQSVQELSDSAFFSFEIHHSMVLLYFEYASLVPLTINSMYTFIILARAKLTYSLPLTKIFSFIVILIVMVCLNILKTYYVINSVDDLSLSQWSLLQAIGIMLVSLANLFVRYLEVYHDELDDIKNFLRVDTIVLTLILASIFFILAFYASGTNAEFVSGLDYYLKSGIDFYNSMSLVEFNIMSSFISMLIITYIMKFAYESTSLLARNEESNIGDLGISYIMGLLFIEISLSFIKPPTSHQFFEYLFVMILFIPVVIIFRNIYSTSLILSVAFITFVLPFGYYITDYWNSVHGFFGILGFILTVGIGVPLYTLLIYLVGKIAIVISEKIYSSIMMQFLLIAIGSSLLFFLR